MQLKPAYHIRLGQDCIDPADKHERISGKAEILEIRDSIFGTDDTSGEYISGSGNLYNTGICESCGGELDCISGSANLYKCEACGCTWEYVGTRGTINIWVCVFDPSQVE